jgi:hypothetical protein
MIRPLRGGSFSFHNGQAFPAAAHQLQSSSSYRFESTYELELKTRTLR